MTDRLAVQIPPQSNVDTFDTHCLNDCEYFSQYVTVNWLRSFALCTMSLVLIMLPIFLHRL